MFNFRPNAPKAYETQRPNTGALAALMKAIGGVGEGAQGISRSAGTSVAEDRLAALTPEERAGANLSDRFGGLALTEQFREKLAQADKDATTAKAVKDKEAFTTKRDKTLHGYNLARDKAKPTTGTGSKEIISNPEIDQQIAEADKVIARMRTDIAGNRTDDGVGLEDKAVIINEAQKAKYDMLKGLNYPEKVAREMAYGISPSMKNLMKRISGNVYKDKKQK